MKEGYVKEKIRIGVHSLMIAQLARERLDKIARKRYRTGKLTSCRQILVQIGKTPATDVLKESALVDPIPLASYAEVFDKVALGCRRDRENTKVCAHVPAQHGKTTLTLAGLIFCMIKRQGCRCMYITFNAGRASDVQQMFVDMVKSLGYNPTSWVGKGQVSFNGSTCIFRSISTGITGYTCDTLCVMDDLFITRWDASSESIREMVWEHVEGDVLSRSQGGCAFICNGTRMNNDDIHQRLIDRHGYRYICIPAISEDSEGNEHALWEDRKSLELLRDMRRADNLFPLFYQGETIAQGQTLFNAEPGTFEELPNSTELRDGWGMDTALTGYGDWCVLCKVTIDDKTGKKYVTGAWRFHLNYEEFAKRVKAIVPDGTPVRWYGSTQEEAQAKIIRRAGVNVVFIPTNKSKQERAQPTYYAWNKQDLLVRAKRDRDEGYEHWVRGVTRFTGEKNEKSPDDVDALVGAFDEVMYGSNDDGPLLDLKEVAKQRQRLQNVTF